MCPNSWSVVKCNNHDETNFKETTQIFANKYNKYNCDFRLIQKSIIVIL